VLRVDENAEFSVLQGASNLICSAQSDRPAAIGCRELVCRIAGRYGDEEGQEMRTRKKLDITPPNSRFRMICFLFAFALCLLPAYWRGPTRALVSAVLPGVLFALALLCAESKKGK
jgi:hypothetical protein